MNIQGILEDDKPYVPSTFFEEQLTAFEVWLAQGSEHRAPPEQLPIVLQVSFRTEGWEKWLLAGMRIRHFFQWIRIRLSWREKIRIRGGEHKWRKEIRKFPFLLKEHDFSVGRGGG